MLCKIIKQKRKIETSKKVKEERRRMREELIKSPPHFKTKPHKSRFAWVGRRRRATVVAVVGVPQTVDNNQSTYDWHYFVGPDD